MNMGSEFLIFLSMFLYLTGSGVQSIRNTKLSIKNNCSYVGEDIDKKLVGTVQDCFDACVDESSCTHFNFVENSVDKLSSLCFLKRAEIKVEDDSSLRHVSAGMCGFVATKSEDIRNNYGITLKDECSFDEFGVLEGESRSLEQCLADCFNDALCNHFSWSAGDRECNLHFQDTMFHVERRLSTTPSVGNKCGWIQKFVEDSGSTDFFESKDNCSYEYSDIRSESTDNAQGCMDACFKNPLCTHFTWTSGADQGSSICTLKKAETKQEIDISINYDPQSKCGLIETRLKGIMDAYGVQINDSCYFWGYRFYDSKVESIEQCVAACLRHDLCNHFSYNEARGQCALHFDYTMGDVRKRLVTRKGFKCGIIGKFVKDLNLSYDMGIKGECNYEGKDFQHKLMGSAQDCKDGCLEDLLCTHFTWIKDTDNVDSSVCQFKKAMKKKEIDGSIKKSSNSNCGMILTKIKDIRHAYGVNISRGCAFKGETFDKKNFGSVDKCLDICFITPLCSHFTWSSESHRCTLHKATSLADIRKNLVKKQGDKCGYIASFLGDTYYEKR